VQLLDVLEAVERVLAIELLVAAQTLGCRRPLRPGRGVELAHETLRETIPHQEEDYLFADDIDESLAFVRDDALLGFLTDEPGGWNECVLRVSGCVRCNGER